MESALLNGLADKCVTKKELFQKIKRNWGLLPEVINGVSSPKPAVRCGCAKVLMDLSVEYPTNSIPTWIHSYTCLTATIESSYGMQWQSSQT